MAEAASRYKVLARLLGLSSTELIPRVPADRFNMARGVLVATFGNDWVNRSLGHPVNTERIDARFPRTALTGWPNDQELGVQCLAKLVCVTAAARKEGSYANLGYWLGRLNPYDVGDLPPGRFRGKFPRTVAGFCLAAAYQLRHEGHTDHAEEVTRAVVKVLSTTAPAGSPPNPTDPLSPEQLERLMREANNKGALTWRQNQALTNALAAVARIMPGEYQPPARTGRQRREAAFEDLQREVATQAPERARSESLHVSGRTIAEFVTFAHVYWQACADSPKIRCKQSAVTAAVSGLRRSMREIFGISDEDFGRVSLGQVNVGAMLRQARNAGVSAPRQSVLRRTLEEWNAFLDAGYITFATRHPPFPRGVDH